VSGISFIIQSFSAFVPAEEEQGEPARASMRTLQAGKNTGRSNYFWIDHEDIFRKGP
jgi:hypothetical protein